MAVGARFSSLTFLLCLYLASEARAGKLLVIPTDGSHWTGIKPLVEELGRRGNRVVVVFPEISGSIRPAENTTTLTFPVPYTQEQLRGKVLGDLEHLMSLDTSNALTRAWSFYKTLQVLKGYTVRSCESLLKNTELLQILKNWKFDSILTDPFEPAGVILGEYLGLHPIYVQSGLPCMVDFEASRCPYPASYVPRRFTHYSDRMTLGERIVNFLRSVSEPMACNYLYSEVNKMASKFLKKETTIPEIMSKASLWLMTVDFALEFPRPLMPNIVMIGGLNCEEPKPLPMDLEEFIEGSGDDGFVVFTLGSMVSQMPEDKAKQFVDAFRQIPQRVVWRYTGPLPDDAPENLKVMKWLPQNDLLGHPKVKAFITHGGTHGIYEGICNGVPMVMLPLFGDQGDNVHRMVVRGVAEALNPFDVTTDKLLGALDKVINDKSYKEKMLKLSAVHMDRPIEPLDLAVFWTEFVMRHKGAEHLRPAAHDLNWIQYHSLDVIAFLTVILITASVVTIKSCLFCCRKCVGSRTLKKKTA